MQLQDTESSNDVTDSKEVNKDEKKLKRKEVSQKLANKLKEAPGPKVPLKDFTRT